MRRVSSLALHPGSELVVLGGRAAFARCTRCPTSDLPYVHTVYPSHLMYREPLLQPPPLRRHLSSSYPELLLSFAATSVGPQRIDVSNIFHPPPATDAVELSLAACLLKIGNFSVYNSSLKAIPRSCFPSTPCFISYVHLLTWSAVSLELHALRSSSDSLPTTP